MKKLLKLIPDFLKSAWLYFPAFFAVCIIYYSLMAVDLAVDTLMVTGEHYMRMGFSLVAIFIWAWIVWFSSRIVGLVHGKGDESENVFDKHMPRFLAINCFVAIQTAILALPHVINLSGWNIVFFILGQVAFFFLLSAGLERNILVKKKEATGRPWQWILSIVIGVVYVAALLGLTIYKYAFAADKGVIHAYRLTGLCLFLFALQIFCLWIFTCRRGFIDDDALFNNPVSRFVDWLNDQPITKLHCRVLEFFGLTNVAAKEEDAYYVMFHGILLIGGIIYFLNVAFVSLSVFWGPMAFTILALAVLITFFNVLSVLSYKVNLNLTIILFVILYFIGGHSFTKEHAIAHQVRIIDASPNAPARMSVDTFLYRWLRNPVRAKDIAGCRPDSQFVAYMVLNDGGGARAATWSALLMSRLEDETHGKFGGHLVSIAGASGGSVGNAAFYGLLKAEKAGLISNQDSLYKHANRFFKGDFLTFTLGRLLGVDVLGYAFPQWLDDRAAALERTFEYPKLDSLTGNFFASNIDTSFDYTGTLPAFFINTTDVRAGITGVVSNVYLDDTLLEDVLARMDSGKTLRVSTSAILSARFPYVSPAGGLKGRYYVDGGYHDNSGAGTTESFLEQIRENTTDTLLTHVNFVVLAIHNCQPGTDTAKIMNPFINDLLAPVFTLLGMENASTDVGNQELNNYMFMTDGVSNPAVFSLYASKDTESYPMSWINSAYQIDRINKRLNEVAKNDTDFKRVISFR